MRFITTILLILLFTVSQYARQMNYIECKVTNIFKDAAVKCDCEKTDQNLTAHTDKDAIPARAHFHPSADEFFLGIKQVKITNHLYVSIPRQYNEFVLRMANGYIADSYRPPCQFSEIFTNLNG